ncbi:MAG: hypothetical protein ACOVNY_07390 [Chitinophagaceae bacterium]
MKKIYTSCIACLCFTQMNAQFKTSQKLLGPSFGIGYSKDEVKGSNGNTINKSDFIGVTIGFSSIKMKSNNKGFGVGLNYDFNKYESISSSSSTDRIHTLRLSIFNRKLIPIKGKWNFYYDYGVLGSMSFSKRNNIFPTVSETEKGNIYRVALFLNPGIIYQVKNNLLLDATFNNFLTGNISYEKFKREDSNGLKQIQKRTYFSAISTLSTSDLLRGMTISIRWII